MKIKREELTADTMVGFFLIALLSESFKGDKFEEFTKDKLDFEVKLTLDGAEVNFVKVLKRYEDQVDSMVEQEAKKVIDMKFQRMYALITNLEQEIKNKAVEAGVIIYNEDDY